jgi:hypothetical protein
MNGYKIIALGLMILSALISAIIFYTSYRVARDIEKNGLKSIVESIWNGEK